MATTATTSVVTPAQTTAPAPVTASSTTATATSQVPVPSTSPVTVTSAATPTTAAPVAAARTTVSTASTPVSALVSTAPSATSAQSTTTSTPSTQPVVTSAATSSQSQAAVNTPVVTAAVTQPIVTPQVTTSTAQSSFMSSGFGRMSSKDMDTLYEDPWRKMVNWYDCEQKRVELLEYMQSYDPLGDLLTDEVQFPVVNILLFGSVGAGKSSVFNSINSVFRGKIFNVARSGNAEHSLTTKFTRYPIMSSGRSKPAPLKFRICDVRGLEQDHLMSKENMRSLLEGHVADRFPFDPSGNMSSDMPGFKKYPELHEKIHCVAIVQDATIVDAMQDLSPEVTKNIKDMQVVMNSLDIPQVVILTKIDSICEKTKNNISDAFLSPKVEDCVAKASEVLGLPRNAILPLKNYETETELDSVIDTLTLLTLNKILDNCDAHLFNHYQEINDKYAIANRRKP